LVTALHSSLPNWAVAKAAMKRIEVHLTVEKGSISALQIADDGVQRLLLQ
jgi:hypothetical protein